MVTSEAPQTNRTARIEAVQIAAFGVRWTGLTFFRKLEPTRPSSRAKAKIMREAEVTVARPHRNCETKIATYNASFSHTGNRWSSAQKKTFQPCFAASFMSGMRTRNPISMEEPDIPHH